MIRPPRRPPRASRPYERKLNAGPEPAPPRDEPARVRKLAEWVTFGVSACIILGVSAFLAYEALQAEPKAIAPDVRPLFEQVARENGRYILPIEVHNPGQRTLRDLKVEVSWTPREGEKETVDFTVDYLGEQSRQTLYFYFDEAPQSLGVEVKPTHYRLN